MLEVARQGDFIIEYVGEVIDAEECRRRIAECEQVNGLPAAELRRCV
jgi:hypothetical protein